ncbi:adenosylcobinamide amidohydrolase [Natronomonas sp.]|uniref:adenosylcobinamide amidohydrolase n=1 Tax=Natronomonas sp. TaxID=2184060 RepID=UPI003989439C
MFEYDRTDDRLTLHRPDTRWLSNGVGGGYRRADAAHNLTVPEGFDRTDLAAYAEERLPEAPPGPTLLTGVSQRHARGARRGPVEAVATAGLSNPAELPIETGARPEMAGERGGREEWRPGTVNVFVGTTRALNESALTGLLATAVEAKSATLLAVAGVPGTTSDAVVVGSAPDGESASFAGSATVVGAAARACVREAVRTSLESRYGGDGPPTTEEARYGVATNERATVFKIE